MHDMQTAPVTLRSPACLHRHPANPILTARQVPYQASLVFNAGVTKWQGRYIMVFRNDAGPNGPDEREKLTHTNIGFAESPDGVNWTVRPQPLAMPGAAAFGLEEGDLRRVYDPRLHVIDGKLVLCMATDTNHGVIGSVVEANDDLSAFTVLATTLPDNRNLVLFPERIGGQYVRLDRPFPVYSRGRDRFDMWLSRSPDLRYWGDHRLVMGVEHVPYANDKIGPAAPPIKTKAGWLCVFHAVDRDETRGKNGWEAKWTKRYSAGIALLDLNDPSKVVGMSKSPLIFPEAPYEVSGGFRDHVIFPTATVLEPDGEVKIWYGAGDAVMALASAHVDELIALCKDPR
jgi:beta-1,4-mannooligosaccharide/beta-1,4-mannosyl-N-acetylglucosamine phosphorylase